MLHIYNYSILILLILYNSEIPLSNLGYTDGVQLGEKVETYLINSFHPHILDRQFFFFCQDFHSKFINIGNIFTPSVLK